MPESTDVSTAISWCAAVAEIDVYKRQAYAYASAQPDYGTFLMAGSPKAGQSLDEVRDLLLAEAAKIRAGEFDEGLIKASINNYKMQLMNEFDKYDQRAMFYVYSFIYGKEWADDIRQLERMEKIDVYKRQHVLCTAFENPVGHIVAQPGGCEQHGPSRGSPLSRSLPERNGMSADTGLRLSGQDIEVGNIIEPIEIPPVSYTHLDVYKRQVSALQYSANFSSV